MLPFGLFSGKALCQGISPLLPEKGWPFCMSSWCSPKVESNLFMSVSSQGTHFSLGATWKEKEGCLGVHAYLPSPSVV